jgi:outer membrane protein assembly factor BamB
MNPVARPSRASFRSVHSFALLLFGSACAAAPDALHLGAAAPAALASPTGFRRAVIDGAPAMDATGDEVALAVGATEDEVIAARLDREPREARQWRVELPVSTPPLLAPGLIAIGSGDELVALSPDDGRRLWTLPTRRAAALALTANARQTALLWGDRRARRWISVYDRGARERLRVTAAASLGSPVLLASTLLVPSGDGYLSAVDVDAGTERARVRLGSAPMEPLWTHAGLFFGGPPWFELAREGPPYDLPRRPLPGPVQIGPVDLIARGLAAPGEEVTRLYVRPTHTRTYEQKDVYMATHGRIVVGLERDGGTLTWVAALPGRVLGAVAVSGGFLVCDESGGVRWLAAQTGRVERQWQLVRRRPVPRGAALLTACALSRGRVLGPAADGADATGRASRAQPEPLLDQLARVLALSDPGLSSGQRFLSRELAARAEPDATRVLIELVTRHNLDRVLQSEAEDLLATRRNGADHMLAALAGSGLRGEESLPPIAPLGDALAALDERRAAPLLARQLNRPAHAPSAIARAAAALEQLASEAEYAELSVFFSLHRTNADGPEWEAAVLSIGRTLLRVGGQKARTLLRFATRDPLTVPRVRSALEQALNGSQADLAR